MAGSSMEFWFEFDNFFNPGFGQVSDEVFDAYSVTGAPFGITGSWRRHRAVGTYPDGFAAEMTPSADALLFLAEQQLVIVDRHFGGDAEAERMAFEEFGQGILFNSRRPAGDKIHKMDKSADDSTAGYHNWHAFIRAAVLVGADEARWLGVDRMVGLAWAIQTVARPVQDAPDNPPLAENRLQALREVWLGLDADQLDDAFDHDPFPPRSLLEVPSQPGAG